MMHQRLPWIQILFILTNAICAVIFAFTYPETKGDYHIIPQ